MDDRLPATTTLGRAELRVADLERSLAFYRDLLGFDVLDLTARSALIGAVRTPLVELRAHAGLLPKPRRAAGLFHLAILLPDRPSLAAMLRRLGEGGIRIGASDHDVSEALYLDDPDGNGLEIYRDRPRADWRWGPDGLVTMGTKPLDTAGLLAAAPAAAAARFRLPAGTVVGHVHLQVGDLDEAARFYVDAVGFDITCRYDRALFVSAGGYHHHVGLNTWYSAGAGAAPAGTAGLAAFELVLSAEGIAALRERLAAHGVAVVSEAGAPVAADPWGNRMRIVPAT